MKHKPNGLTPLFLSVGLFLLVAFIFLYQSTFFFEPVRYSAEKASGATAKSVPRVLHVATPEVVKAVYMSQCLASDKTLRARLVALVNETELNAVVIDVKDYSGRISFPSANPMFSESLSPECAARDMQAFLESLHEQSIYVIGRVTVFQDPFYAKRHPELAVKRNSDHSVLWRDKKGINYLDPGAQDVWDYALTLAREAHAIGFDEINFDYIRFPSDGDMNDIYFPFSEEFIDLDPEGGKSGVLRGFFSYLTGELRKENITTSADLFGMTTTNTDDLNIGQVLEDALSSFDFVAPMVYPSHYPLTFIGIQNPATKPYEVVKYSMDAAMKRASTTPWKLRPWLQDFSLGAVYTPDMVRAQIQATYDSGFGSWMLWDAANTYTREALLPE
ncbi:MAG TPA: putative glycoside hydrolase [Candidatus Paceibacterota bacterium]